MTPTKAPTAEEQLIASPSSGANTAPPDLRLLHYNDVYHVEAGSREPVGGYARFQTLVNYYRDDERFHGQPKVLTFFSGDAFNPSIESSITKGAVAEDGHNHDLDFGVKQYRHLSSKCKFPWLLANVLDPALGEGVPLGNAQRTVMLTSSNGIKVGVIGLAEREWLDTINSLPPDIIYKSASATAKELIPGLKEQGAEIIVCVSHQREPNDNKLAEKTGGDLIDIILGGHDHYYSYSHINGTHVLRSGTDFKQLSHIEAWRKPEGKGWDFKIIRRDIVSSIPQDAAAVVLVDEQTQEIRKRLDKPIGYTAAPLDARFTTVRTKESNIGNFVCDLMRYYYSADCCIMAAGTIRGDQIYPPGVLKLRDIVNCFPFEDPVVVLKVTGKAILAALENGVSKYPALEGRFPQVSNITFETDYSKPPHSRIQNVTIGSEPLDEKREYVLATRGYMGRGKDGYTALLIEEEGGVAKEIVSEENGVLISTILRQYFMSLKVLGRWKRMGQSLNNRFLSIQTNLQNNHKHMFHDASPTKPDSAEPRQSPSMDRVVRSAAAGQTKDRPDDADTDEDEDEDDGLMYHDSVPIRFNERQMEMVRQVMHKWWRLAGLKHTPSLCDELDGKEFVVNWTKAIAPRLEGRIKEVGRNTPYTDFISVTFLSCTVLKGSAQSMESMGTDDHISWVATMTGEVPDTWVKEESCAEWAADKDVNSLKQELEQAQKVKAETQRYTDVLEKRYTDVLEKRYADALEKEREVARNSLKNLCEEIKRVEAVSQSSKEARARLKEALDEERREHKHTKRCREADQAMLMTANSRWDVETERADKERATVQRQADELSAKDKELKAVKGKLRAQAQELKVARAEVAATREEMSTVRKRMREMREHGAGKRHADTDTQSSRRKRVRTEPEEW
ncbi:hypothetical protein ACEQ8H_003162 [Pleosporales sp. CAS-2024a]